MIFAYGFPRVYQMGTTGVRALALKHHPDKGGDSDTFKIIARAYKVLSDDDTRQRYDRFGEEGSGGGARPPAPPAP